MVSSDMVRRMSTVMLPATGVYLSAFERMLSNTARKRSGSAEIRGISGSIRVDQGNALSPRLPLDSPQRLRDDGGHMDGFEIEPQLASFDTCQIEKLVDGLGQLLDADQRRRDELPLAFGKQM